MATFSSHDFSYHHYSSFRPTYPPHLYNTILTYHKGPKNVALDLGTGHGLVARELSTHFQKVHASDPSPGMIQQAQELSTQQTNITFHSSTAEDSAFLPDGSVDMVTAAQAAHWFDYPRLWPELARAVRAGGTVAFWGYTDPAVVSRPRATELIHQYAYGADPRFMGSFWQQPGRDIVQGKLRAVVPPETEWEVTRVEYEPTTGEGTMFMHGGMKLGDFAEFVRTWSAFHGWQQRWPERKRRDESRNGEGDVVDELMDRIREEEPELRGEGVKGGWKEVVVDLEWGTGLVLARRR